MRLIERRLLAEQSIAHIQQAWEDGEYEQDERAYRRDLASAERELARVEALQLSQ